jgi:hypothetical protein
MADGEGRPAKRKEGEGKEDPVLERTGLRMIFHLPTDWWSLSFHISNTSFRKPGKPYARASPSI